VSSTSLHPHAMHTVDQNIFLSIKKKKKKNKTKTPSRGHFNSKDMSLVRIKMLQKGWGKIEGEEGKSK